MASTQSYRLKETSPLSSGDEICFEVTNTTGQKTDVEDLKGFIRDTYIRRSDGKINKDNTPYITLYAEKDGLVCIVLTSRSKETNSVIESINASLSGGLRYKHLVLSAPKIFGVEVKNWWNSIENISDNKENWTELRHRGPYFTHLEEPYEFLGSSLIYDGRKYSLSPEEEEIAILYARRLISESTGKVAKDALRTKQKSFNQNFWDDFKGYLSTSNRRAIKDFDKIDWTDVIEKLNQKKERNNTIEEKKRRKVRNMEKIHNYGYALIDGDREKLGNFVVEPVGIYMGRGKVHPLGGKIKRKIMPEDVTINISNLKDAPAPPYGHRWGSVVRNPNVAWVAKYKDSIRGDDKYVWFAFEGRFKGIADFKKHEIARTLHRGIKQIRESYMADAHSSDPVLKQLGTVLYLIDHFGLRVGGEKKEDDVDTIGASTLRVENATMKPPNKMTLDFLGKDSIEFHKDLQLDKTIYGNISSLIKGKDKKANIFNLISSDTINEYLKNFNPDFSAKVFRTRLASEVMHRGLKNLKIAPGTTKQATKTQFNKANVEVANIMNHTRMLGVQATENLAKLEEKVEELTNEIFELESSGDESDCNKINKLRKELEKKEALLEAKGDTKAVAINTSLQNYIDPRIVFSWEKRENLSEGTIYTKTMMKRFKWASNVSGNWDWIKSPITTSNDNPKAEGGPGPSKKGSKKAPSKNVLAKKIADNLPTRQQLPAIISTPIHPNRQQLPDIIPPQIYTGHKDNSGEPIVFTEFPPEMKVSVQNGWGYLDLDEPSLHILKKFCENPRQNTKELLTVTDDVLAWIYPFAQAAVSLKTSPTIGKILVNLHEKRSSQKIITKDVKKKAPKPKTKTGFAVFSQIHKPRILRDHPLKEPGEINAILKENWNKMSDDQKKRYEDIASGIKHSVHIPTQIEETIPETTKVPITKKARKSGFENFMEYALEKLEFHRGDDLIDELPMSKEIYATKLKARLAVLKEKFDPFIKQTRDIIKKEARPGLDEQINLIEGFWSLIPPEEKQKYGHVLDPQDNNKYQYAIQLTQLTPPVKIYNIPGKIDERFPLQKDI